MITYILFDNDGVLVDTEKYYFESSRIVLKEVGLVLTPEIFNEISLTKGVGVWEAFRTSLTDDNIVQLRKKRDTLYRSMLSQKPLLIDGIEAVLAELEERYRMAIITTAMREDFETIHQRTGLLKHFEFYLTNGDYPLSKPAPDPYLAGIEKMGLPATQGVVVEDTLRGVRSAKKAGLQVIAIPNSFNKNDDFREADFVLDSIKSLPKLIASL